MCNSEVSEVDGKALADRWNCPFVECSAKHNDNIREAFTRVLVTIHRQEDGDLEDPGCCGTLRVLRRSFLPQPHTSLSPFSRTGQTVCLHATCKA